MEKRRLIFDRSELKVFAQDDDGVRVAVLDLYRSHLDDDECALLEEMVYAWNEANR